MRGPSSWKPKRESAKRTKEKRADANAKRNELARKITAEERARKGHFKKQVLKRMKEAGYKISVDTLDAILEGKLR